MRIWTTNINSESIREVDIFTFTQEPMGAPSTNAIADAIGETYRQFAKGPQFSMDVSSESVEGKAVMALCRQSEMRPLIRGMQFQICVGLGTPFRTLNADTIQLDRSILAPPLAAAFHFRHALELATLYRAVPGSANLTARLACAISAFYTAFTYLQIIHQCESDMPLQHCEDWIRSAFVVISADDMIHGTAQDTAKAICQYWQHLLPLQGIDTEQIKAMPDRKEMFNCACKLASGILPLAMPSEHLLTTGGDNRLLIESRTGLNQYGCSPKPRPWAITFSSCTASSISDIGYQKVERLRQSLLSALSNNSLSDNFIGETERIRREVVSTLQLDRLPGTEVILTSSGTDGELYALYFALAGHNNNLLNILMAPKEVGSGSLPAAQGLHFDELTPMGGSVALGTPVQGLQASRVKVEPLSVRHESGAVVPLEKIDLKVVSLVSQAVHKGDSVLIHLLDSSKTGLKAPSMKTVRRLKEVYGDVVWGVVDAAQMRLDTDGLKKYLEQGFLVLVTGSKFFTGAPFSGALVVPPAIARQVDRLPPFPAGFAGFATRYDFPPRWYFLASQLPDYPNIGLLLRWQSALWEMKAFQSTPQSERFQTVQKFGNAVLDMITNNPDLELVAAPLHQPMEDVQRLQWDQLPSIFTFFVLKKNRYNDQVVPLTYEEARRAYRMLNMDISKFLPQQATERERKLAAKQCHIAQPVRIRRQRGQWLAALRMAVGARLVSGVHFDPCLGPTPEERLATEIRDAGTVLEKLSIIARYWEPFCRIDGKSRLDSNKAESASNDDDHPF
jgi:hypothetical protein